MKTLCLYKRRTSHRRWYRPVLEHFAANGYRIDIRIGRPPPRVDWSRVIIWNGNHWKERLFAEACQQAGTPVNYLEVGYFPQSKYAMLSRHGSVGGHLFLNETIPPLPADGESRLRKQFESYADCQKYQPVQTSGFLQLPRDYAITAHSRFRSMQQYIDEVEPSYPDAVFKVHPKQRRVSCKATHPFYRGTLWRHIMRAKLCVGINSTCLFEAALAGVPVIALGDSPLSRHPDLHREIVHEILMRQLPVDGSDMGEQVYRSVGDI